MLNHVGNEYVLQCLGLCTAKLTDCWLHVSGVTESLFSGPRGGEREDSVAIFFSPSYFLCTIKSQMGGP